MNKCATKEQKSIKRLLDALSGKYRAYYQEAKADVVCPLLVDIATGKITRKLKTEEGCEIIPIPRRR